jgi:hypothetical protein
VAGCGWDGMVCVGSQGVTTGMAGSGWGGRAWVGSQGVCGITGRFRYLQIPG